MGSSTAYWYVENHIIYVRNAGDLTAELFREVNEQISMYMRQAHEKNTETKIHVLVDALDMNKVPHVTQLEGGRILSYMKEPNCGWTVVVGKRNNVFLKVISQLLTSIMGVNLHMTDTLKKGLGLIKQVEPTLSRIPDIEDWMAHNLQTS